MAKKTTRQGLKAAKKGKAAAVKKPKERTKADQKAMHGDVLRERAGRCQEQHRRDQRKCEPEGNASRTIRRGDITFRRFAHRRIGARRALPDLQPAGEAKQCECDQAPRPDPGLLPAGEQRFQDRRLMNLYPAVLDFHPQMPRRRKSDPLQAG